MTVILSVLGWGGLARQVRGKVLAVREADFVMAARAAGAGPFYIARKHLLPTAAGHVIVTATLAIPGMILGETALSFLGLGIRPPLVSWGLLLEDAQRVNVLVNDPWLLAPALPIVVTVIAWNLIGEALRDAIDPGTAGLARCARIDLGGCTAAVPEPVAGSGGCSLGKAGKAPDRGATVAAFATEGRAWLRSSYEEGIAKLVMATVERRSVLVCVGDRAASDTPTGSGTAALPVPIQCERSERVPLDSEAKRGPIDPYC